MHLLKDLLLVFAMFLAVYLSFYLGMRHEPLEDKMQRYDCSLTEFVPDVPAEVRNECRRRRVELINQEKAE